MNKRIEQLDSLRGIAAFAVVLHHLPLVAFALPAFYVSLLRLTGINYGHGPVMLFFVLSGFVLSIPFLEKRWEGNRYFPYVVKRYCRIYIPYIVGILFAIALSQLFWTEKVEVVGTYEHMLWSTPLDLQLIVEHIYFLGNIHSNAFNGVIWSLIHELRISIIFPFVVLFVKRFDWKISVLLCMILSAISGLNNIFDFQTSNGNDITYFHTLHYTSLFILGALLAKHRKDIITNYRKLETSTKYIFLMTSFILYNFSEIFTGYLYILTNIEIISVYFFIIMEYGIAFGSVGFMISAMGSSRVERILLLRPFRFLGKISYSLYLYHLPVILTCIYLFHSVLPLWIICMIAVPMSVIISSIAWYLVERPSITFGRFLAKKVKGRQLTLNAKFKKRTV
ncbi:acyltransferase family protein [Ornithinibacillus californiensis]|uniref:acyltransferase family protein n=1 Tax=Ornithinibacillus californiensis TaxID=161536 RepID=UPI00064DB9AE|nr:acyltransferase [Ornithinibacillus californiensis]